MKQSLKMPEDIRENNIRMILEQFTLNYQQTISALEENTRISKTTILKIVSQLVDTGVLSNVGKALPSEDKGRRPNIFALNYTYRHIITIQIFPQKLYTAITDLQNQIVATESVPIANTMTFDETMETLINTIYMILKRQDIDIKNVEGISIATPGPTDYESGKVIYSPRFPNWCRNAPVKEKLKAYFPETIKIVVENEMRLQAIAERYIGKATSNSIVLDAGDKLVAGIINHNGVVRGAHGTAGEIGHIILDSNSNIQCVCGAYGCFLSLVSTERAISFVKDNIHAYPSSVLARVHEKIEMEDLFDAYQKQDPLGGIVIEEIAKWFGLGLSNIILMYDPKTIIIQGVYAKAGQKFLDQGKKHTKKGTYPLLKEISTNIEYSSLDKDAGILGGSILISQSFVKNFVLPM